MFCYSNCILKINYIALKCIILENLRIFLSLLSERKTKSILKNMYDFHNCTGIS